MYKIAIIDDETDLRDVLKMLILTCGSFEVETFSCVADFLKRNEDQSFQTIFSDLNLPGINGLECSKIIFSENKKQKFILMSGADLGEINQQKYNVDHYLCKPFSLQSLKNVLSV
jgi:DNA-binding NtrC family response regulator